MRKSALLIGLFSFLCSVQAFACIGGQEFTKDVGLYMVDVTNDTPVMQPGMTVHFDFGLINKSDPAYGPDESVPFDLVEATITHRGETIFNKKMPLEANRELTGFDFQFPNQGADDLLVVHYTKGNKILADASFPLQVGNGDAAAKTLPIIFGVIAAVAIVAPILSRMKMRVR